MTDENLQGISDELRDIRNQIERISEEIKGEITDIKGKLNLLDDVQGKVAQLSENAPKQAKVSQFHLNMNYCIAAMVAGVAVANLGYAQSWPCGIWAGTILSILGIVGTFIVIFTRAHHSGDR